MDDIQNKIGTAFMDTFGGLCLETVNNGYDLDTLYDGGRKWGDFSKVILAVAAGRGVKSYDGYLELFEKIKPADHEPVTKQMFARFTGISTVDNKSQVTYNKRYRNKTKAELDELRALNALYWIDDNVEQAKEYLNKITNTKK